MTAEPIRRSPRPSARRADSRLAQAHQEEAAALEYVHQSNQQIQHALDAEAVEREFWWHTAGDREARFRIYLDAQERTEILAIELLEWEYRPPSPRERASLETRLWSEISGQTDVWLKLRELAH